jgi:hypothetical protein
VVFPARRRSFTVRSVPSSVGANVTVRGLTAVNGRGPAARKSIRPRRR